MNKIDPQIDKLLASMIRYLKAQTPYLYADHQNLFVELGWDISSGNGEVTDHVRNLLEVEVEKYPTMLKQWLWWNIWSGQYEHEKIEKGLLELDELNPDLKVFEFDEDFDLVNEIVDKLTERLFLLAELEFEQYLEEDEDWDEEEDKDEMNE